MMQIELGKSVELVTKGTTPTSLSEKFTKSGIKFLRAQNVVDGKVLIDDDILFIDNETHNSKLKRSQIIKGDVLLTIAGTIGRTAIVEIDEELNCNQAVAIIRLGNSQIHPNFLCHFFASNSAQSQFTIGKVTATIPNLSLSQIKKLKIPLPPLPQQKKIASILDIADDYRQKTKALIAKYDELTQSLFLDMFGDPVTNPKGWEKIPLGKLSERIVVGHVGPTSDGYTEFGIPFLRTQNVRPNFINYNDLAQITSEFHNKLKKSQIFAKDILISRVGVNRGMAAVVPDDLNEANCANVVIVGNTKFLNSYYLSFFLNKSFGTKPEYGYSVGSAQGVVNTSIVKKWPVFNASLELQNQFADRVQAIEAQKAQAQESLAKAEDLFNSLLQKAFKGELTN